MEINVPLTSAEEVWLSEAMRRRLASEKCDSTSMFAALVDLLPPGFDPDQIDGQLYSNDELTLLGVVLVDPDDDEALAADHLIVAIRELIKLNPNLSEVHADDLSRRTGLAHATVARLLKRLSSTGLFHSSGTLGGPDGGWSSAHICRGRDRRVCHAYLRYKDLGSLVEPLRQSRSEKVSAIASQDIREALWIVESDDGDVDLMTQGTAFHLAGLGLITCDHVLGTSNVLYRPGSIERHAARVMLRNPTIDLAVLHLEGQALGSSVRPGAAASLVQGSEVVLYGFPNYGPNQSHHAERGHVTSFETVSGILRFNVSCSIVAGNSGGPVLDSFGLVVGIAVTGVDAAERAKTTVRHGVIPIDALFSLFRDFLVNLA